MLNLTQMKARRRAPPTEKPQYMTKPVAAPEIFQIPLDQIDPAIAPPNTKPGATEFEQAVIMHYVLRYAGKGWQAMVTVDNGFVRVLAIPQHPESRSTTFVPGIRERSDTVAGISPIDF